VPTRRPESQRFPRLDRLPLVGAALSLAALGALAGCTTNEKPAPPPARVVAVSQSKQQADASELCDRLYAPSEAPGFALPELAGAAPPHDGGGWLWINAWATWCPPCTEELPLLARFQSALRARKTAVTLRLLAVDQDDAAVEKFAQSQPMVRESLRIKDMRALSDWLPTIGLDSGATLPIHVFVDAERRVRCTRTGALRESDLPLIEQLLGNSRPPG
jgi:thiol-disulfide isomerase/thioredoxin